MLDASECEPRNPLPPAPPSPSAKTSGIRRRRHRHRRNHPHISPILVPQQAIAFARGRLREAREPRIVDPLRPHIVVEHVQRHIRRSAIKVEDLSAVEVDVAFRCQIPAGDGRRLEEAAISSAWPVSHDCRAWAWWASGTISARQMTPAPPRIRRPCGLISTMPTSIAAARPLNTASAAQAP